jgi:cytochrome b
MRVMSKFIVPPTAQNQIRVWDLGVRIFHWSLVGMFTLSYVLADQRSLHLKLGYVVLALMTFRLAWGFVGGKHARFIDFVTSPLTVTKFLVAMLKGKESRYLGHNPAGGVMIVALLLTITSIGVSGYMISTDMFFGVEWVETAHKALVNFCLLLIFGHICGVLYASYHHRENLVKSMLTGLKKPDDRLQPDD